MSCSFQRAQVNVSDACNFHIVKRQVPFDVNGALTVYKIGLAEVRCFSIHSEAKLRPSSSLGKLNVNIVAINGLFEPFYAPLRPQAHYNWMIPFTQSFN